MIDDIALNEVAGFIALLTIVPATLNALIYGVGSPWWRSWLGRVLFAKWLAVALVFVFIVARRTLGEFPGYGVVALLLYTFVLLAFAATTVELVIERRNPAPLNPPRKELPPMSHVALNAGTVPEIWYKAQRVLRTIVAVGIPSIITAATVLPLIIEALGLPADLPLRLWLLAAAGGLTAVAAAITRIMAIPQVNAWLTNIGLGSVPKVAIVAPQAVVVDPKVAEHGAAAARQWSAGSGDGSVK